MMSSALDYFTSNASKRRVLVATDDQTGEALGWICWGVHGYEWDGADARARPRAAPAEEPVPAADVSGETAAEHGDGADRTAPTRPTAEGLVDRLEEICSADLARNQAMLILSAQTRAMCVMAVCVHPSHQGKGVGAELFRWGTQRADAEDVFCWVSASENVQAFVKAGFERVARFEVNLDEFALEPPPLQILEEGMAQSEGGRGWGLYSFHTMKREARNRPRTKTP